jgi:hypothetical protein
LALSLIAVQSCQKNTGEPNSHRQETSKAEIISIKELYSETTSNAGLQLRGNSSDNKLLTFRIDSSKIYRVKQENGTITYSMRLIPSTGDSRREFL